MRDLAIDTSSRPSRATAAPTRRLRTVKRGTLLLIVLALAAAACDGGDSKRSSGRDRNTGSTPRTTVAQPTGEPVKLMVIAPDDQTTGQNLPDNRASATAAAMAINDAGGIGGRPVEVLFCNERNDPNEAAKCGREAVDQKVAAVVGAYTRYGASYLPILEQAGIASIGNIALSADDFGNAVSFPFDGGTLTYFAGSAFALEKAGATKVAVVRTDVDAAKTASTFAQNGIQAAGLEFAAEVAVPVDATDYAPFAAAIASSGADGVILAQAEQAASLLLQAMAQSGLLDRVTVAVPANTLSRETAEALGATILDGTVGAHGFPPVTATKEFPELRQYKKEMDAAQKAGVADAELRRATNLGSWIAVHVVAILAEDLAVVDNTTLLEALRSAEDVKVPFIPSWTPNKTVNSNFPRVSNPAVYFQEFDGTDLVLLDAKPFNIFEALGMATST